MGPKGLAAVVMAAASATAWAAEPGAKAVEKASGASGSVETLIVLAVLGALGYLFYSAGMFSSVSSGPRDEH